MTTLTVPADDLFGLHNLPYGVYSVPGRDPRVAVRYGDHVIDLGTLLDDDETFASTGRARGERCRGRRQGRKRLAPSPRW